MDVSSAKAKNIIDAATASKNNKSTTEQIIGDFSAAVAERMKMSGQNVAGGSQTGLVGALTTKSDTQSQSQPEQQAAKASPRDDHQPRERAEAPDRDVDDYARTTDTKDTAPRENPQHDDTRSNVSDDDADHDASSEQQSQSSGRDAGDNKDTSQDSETAQAGDGEDTGETGEVSAEQENTGQTQDVLASVVDVVQQTTASTGDNATKQNAGAGVDKAAAGVANQQTNVNVGDGVEEQADLDMAGENAAKKNASDTGQKQTQASAGLKTENNHTLNQDASMKQQQAADIASKVGQNQKLDVNVTVTKQSEQLVSQPAATLGAQAAIADDGDSLTQTTAQTAAKGPAQGQQAASTHNLGNQAGQQGQEGQQQAQQNMQAAIAEAAKNTASTDTKSQAAQTANNAATSTVKVGGGEGAPNAQAAPQTTTTQQQAATPQKATQNPQAQHRAQVNEQVNVQITKAIANGMDKISIQLKPAHLGRIDVQLEMASDGRVSAVITADNKDTLDLLKQDSRELEKAMREAGLQMNSGDLSFNLRENGNQGQDGDDTAGSGRAPLTNEPTLDELLEANTGRPNIISEDRIDITA